MAKKQRTSKPRPTPDLPSEEALRRYVRNEGARFLDTPNINSVGIGRKSSTDPAKDGKLCIQFTVDRKVAPEGLESLDSRLIPPTVLIDGHAVLTDVVERRFAQSYRVLPESSTRKDPRKQRQDVLRGGLSVAHARSSAGTLGCVVYDEHTGQPLILSNWHVLHTPDGAVGDVVVQPGPFDDNDTDLNVCGRLLRSHLGPAGDCAVATIEGRGVDPEILGLGPPPVQIGKAELDDVVVKSGRTTGVTYGRVVRVEVQTKMWYGGRSVVIGGFEIGYDRRWKPKDGEISMAGDSGSAWLAVRPGTRKVSDVLLGLHFAGETGADTPEFALACNAHSVFEKLGVTLQPPGGTAGEGRSVGGGRARPVLERTFGGEGYDPQFLGTRLALPVPTSATRRDLAGTAGSLFVPYTHFSLTMRRSRRLCAMVAWNIDGASVRKVDKDAAWSIDGRIEREHQTDNALYAGTRFDRGHVAKREDVVWGSAAEAKRANDDSFCYTNATPQHERFNRLAPAIWKSLEDEIMRQVRPQGLRLSVFAGPIFSPSDREFRPSGMARGAPAVKIPRAFFKIVAYRDEAVGRLKAHGFILSQAELVAGRLELVEPEALDLSVFRMYQDTVAAIGERVGFRMPDLTRFDTKLRGAGGELLTAEAVTGPHAVERFDDIV